MPTIPRMCTNILRALGAFVGGSFCQNGSEHKFVSLAGRCGESRRRRLHCDRRMCDPPTRRLSSPSLIKKFKFMERNRHVNASKRGWLVQADTLAGPREAPLLMGPLCQISSGRCRLHGSNKHDKARTRPPKSTRLHSDFLVLAFRRRGCTATLNHIQGPVYHQPWASAEGRWALAARSTPTSRETAR